MKIRASEMVIGYRFRGHEVLSIARGVGGLFVFLAGSDRDLWLRNDEQIEVNDR